MFDAGTLEQVGWHGKASTLATPQLLPTSIIDGLPSLVASEHVATTLTVSGPTLGDLARASFSLNLQDAARRPGFRRPT